MYPIGTKLGVSEFFYTHVGRYVGNGMVFHNHQKNGAEIVALHEFANGKGLKVLDQGVQNPQAFLHRVQHVLAFGKPYHLLNNNCEHTASFISTGVASSPQLAFYGIVSLIALGVGLSRRAR